MGDVHNCRNQPDKFGIQGNREFRDMKMLQVRTLGGYKPAFGQDYENAKRHKAGDIIEWECKEKRNSGFHRKFFSLLELAFQNQNTTDHREAFRKWMIINAGYFTLVQFPDGTSEKIADSISFAKMDQEQFERVFQDVLQVAINVVGAKEEEILKELINFM